MFDRATIRLGIGPHSSNNKVPVRLVDELLCFNLQILQLSLKVLGTSTKSRARSIHWSAGLEECRHPSMSFLRLVALCFIDIINRHFNVCLYYYIMCSNVVQFSVLSDSSSQTFFASCTLSPHVRMSFASKIVWLKSCIPYNIRLCTVKQCLICD